MNELTKDLRIIELFGGVQIPLEKERIETMLQQLRSGAKYIDLGDSEGFMVSAVAHWLKAPRHEDATRRRNGSWQCVRGNWHDKGEKCKCFTQAEQKYLLDREEAIKNCGKCTGGWLQVGNNSVKECDCIKNIKRL